MGCQRVTPGMVSLAKKFKDQPFHLLASHCQRGDRDQVLKGLEAQGWTAEMDNFTVSSQTRFKPGVKVGRYVPYYFIFDHTGKLRHHHQAGPWHGGDGDKYQELVAALMKEVPKKESEEPSRPLSKLRIWTNADGKTMEAELLEVADGQGKFRKSNGSVFHYPVDQLDQKSREFITALLGEEDG